MLTLWRNARIATCDARDRVFEHGALVTDGERIAWVGDESTLPAGIRPARTIELAGRWITPGLIDCHTHLVFAGERSAEFARRTSGESYAQIAREGGGILSTVRATRAATGEQLLEQSRRRLRSLLQEGVTAVEVKSGYGLDLVTETRLLRVARELGSSHPVTVAATFLAAHALPPEYAGRTDDYVDIVCRDWLPQLAAQRLVDSVDAFCEDIAFSVAQCEKVFAAAATLGLPVRLHAEQLSNIGGSSMAARHRALSCDHLEYATESDIAALRAAGTVAVMLPIAYYALAETQLPPIAACRRLGVPLAVASDCNPGSSPAASLLLAMNMARRLFGMTSAEVLAGVTRHAAQALGQQDRRGTLQAGLAADLAVWSVDTLDELGYWLGFNPCSMVVRHGDIVLERPV